MPIYSRKERYKKLHNQIAVDNESEINVDAGGVGEYAERLDRIEPAILRHERNSVEEFNRTLDHLYQVIGNTPYAGMSRPDRGARTPSYPYEPVQASQNEASYSHYKPAQPAKEESISFIRPTINVQPESEEEKPEQFDPDDTEQEEPRKPMTAEDIKNEIEQLLKEDISLTQSDTFEVQDWPEAEPDRSEPQEIRREFSEYQDETEKYERKIRKTEKAIGLTLNILIVVLVLILITVVFLIVKNRLGIQFPA